MLALLCACALAMMMRETWQLVVYGLAFGLGMGIGYVFDGAVWPNLFGRQFQGEIRGFVYTSSVIGSAFGPALFGLSFDKSGGYAPALWLGAALSLALLLAALFTPRHRVAKLKRKVRLERLTHGRVLRLLSIIHSTSEPPAPLGNPSRTKPLRPPLSSVVKNRSIFAQGTNSSSLSRFDL